MIQKQFNSEEYNSAFDQFPTIQEYHDSLERLKGLNLSNASFEEIKVELTRHAVILPFPIGYLEPNSFNHHMFFRARMNINPEEEDIGLVRTYGYPMPCFCRSNGRANIAGRSVFYCSNDAMTAILESKPIPGQVGYLSVWKANSNRQVKSSIFLPKELTASNIWHLMSKEAHAYCENHSTSYWGDKAEYINLLNRFFADQFVMEGFPYPITSFISNASLYSSEWKDFVIYPSIVSKTTSCNMAFHPQSADTLLQFQKVVRFTVLEIQGEKIKISTGRVGEIDVTNIKWRYAFENELDQLIGSAGVKMSQIS